MSRREYKYVGPRELIAEADSAIERVEPGSVDELVRWLTSQGSLGVVATFIVDTSGRLWLSARGTEHVACARGLPVLGAGEIMFRARGRLVSIVSITNQSTGYCPEPESWYEVRRAIERIGLKAPHGFTHAFEFRRCTNCGMINILKADSPECPVCGTLLPGRWNLDVHVTRQ